MKHTLIQTIHKHMIIACSMLLLGTSALCTHAKPPEKNLDQIAVIINDDVITKSELNRAILLAKKQIMQEHIPIPADEILHQQVLNQLISKKLQMQVARQMKLEVTDQELKMIIAKVAKQNHLTVPDLYLHLNQEGISTPDYQTELREQILLQKVEQQELAGKINVSPEEVKNFMHSRQWENNREKEYHLEDLLIPVPENPSNADISAAKARANEVYQKLIRGLSFDKARVELKGRPALEGGDLGFRKLPEVPTAFAELVLSMHNHEIAKPIQTSNGFHILHLIDSRNLSGTNAPTQKDAEQILMQKKIAEAVDVWVSKLRSQSFVQINP